MHFETQPLVLHGAFGMKMSHPADLYEQEIGVVAGLEVVLPLTDDHNRPQGLDALAADLHPAALQDTEVTASLAGQLVLHNKCAAG